MTYYVRVYSVEQADTSAKQRIALPILARKGECETARALPR